MAEMMKKELDVKDFEMTSTVEDTCFVNIPVFIVFVSFREYSLIQGNYSYSLDFHIKLVFFHVYKRINRFQISYLDILLIFCFSVCLYSTNGKTAKKKISEPCDIRDFRGTSQNRTGDTWIFSPLLYHLS